MKNKYLAILAVIFAYTGSLFAMEPLVPNSPSKTDDQKMVFLEDFSNIRILFPCFEDNFDLILDEFFPFLTDENPKISKKGLLCLVKFIENNEWKATWNVDFSSYITRYHNTISKIRNKKGGIVDAIVNFINFNDEEVILNAYKCLLVMLKRRVPGENMNGTILRLIDEISKKLMLESEEELEHKRSILTLIFLREIYDTSGCRPENIIVTLLTSLPKLKSPELTSAVLNFVASLAKNAENGKKIISLGLRDITNLAMSSHIAGLAPEQASMILKPISNCFIFLFLNKHRTGNVFVPWNKAITEDETLFNFACALLDKNDDGFIYPATIRKTAGYITQHLQLPVKGSKEELSVILSELLAFKSTLENALLTKHCQREDLQGIPFAEAPDQLMLNEALALALRQEPHKHCTFEASLKKFLLINKLDKITLAEVLEKISQTLRLGEERVSSGAFKECCRYMLGDDFAEVPEEDSIYCLIFLSQIDWGDNILAAFDMNAAATFYKILQKESAMHTNCIKYNGQLFECLTRLIELDDLGVIHKQIASLNIGPLTRKITSNAEYLFNNDANKLNHLKELMSKLELCLQSDKFSFQMNHIKNDLTLHSLPWQTRKHLWYFASLLLDNKSNEFSEKICLSTSIVLASELKRQILTGLWLSYHWELINQHAENPLEAFKSK